MSRLQEAQYIRSRVAELLQLPDNTDTQVKELRGMLADANRIIKEEEAGAMSYEQLLALQLDILEAGEE